MTKLSEFITVGEYAKLTGKKRQWVYYLLANGRLPYKIIGGHYFIDKNNTIDNQSVRRNSEK